MKYLIVYDPRKRKTLLMERYPDDAGEQVRLRRSEVERQERRMGHDVEVLVLQSEDEQSLRNTHARYFGGVDRKSILRRLLSHQ